MDMKKLAMAAAIVFMIPAGLAFAMPSMAPGTAVELKAAKYDYTTDAFVSWCGWWGEKRQTAP